MVNNTMTSRQKVPVHLMEKLSETAPEGDNGGASPPPARAFQLFLAHVVVYLDAFIGIVQGGPEEQRQITLRLFFHRFVIPYQQSTRSGKGKTNLFEETGEGNAQ